MSLEFLQRLSPRGVFVGLGGGGVGINALSRSCSAQVAEMGCTIPTHTLKSR
jgi:hypothetical protein